MSIDEEFADFVWVADLDGTPVVVDVWHNIDAPQTLIDRASRARDSIRLVPAD